MQIGLVYWILMLIWALFGVVWNVSPGVYGHYGPLGNVVLMFILFVLLGVQNFGNPIKRD
jgi:hypothetical protein